MLLVLHALGASLDNLEVGGPWGTPLATDATATWWNPAGLGAGAGTRWQLELAPTFATVTYDRAEPNAGTDVLKLAGPVPFLGVVSDLGVDGLGLGLGAAMPFVRGGEETVDGGVGRYHLREGMNRAWWFSLGASYEVKDLVAVGASVALVRAEWTARLDTETLPDLYDAILAEDEIPTYTDADLEDPDYATVVDYGTLDDVTASFSAGVQVRPTERVALGVVYVHGARISVDGDMTLQFGCPPESDTLGRFGVERLGLCDATVAAHGGVGYELPARVHGGLQVTPMDGLRIEAMGGWVHWSVFDDYDITIEDATYADGTPLDDEAAELVNQRKPWARANRDSGWGALDVKGEVGRRWTFGGRVTYDRAAVPDEAVSTNNYDANEVMVSGLAAVEIVEALELGLSFTHHFVQTRTIGDSLFAVAVEGPADGGERWFYPHANGTYSGTIDRFGIQVRGAFD